MQLTTIDTNILHLLGAGETRSEALAPVLRVPPRTVRYRLSRLRDAGLVQLTGHDWTLTGAGTQAALAATIPEPVASIAVLEDLPAEHWAMLRLIENAVVARRALRDVYPGNWPGFVALGPTKSGKTLVGSLAARRFGLDPVDAVRLLMLETPGSLVARRVQTDADTWPSVPSPLLALPLVVLDEFDKATPEVQKAAFAYLAGTSQYSAEHGLIEVHATAIITLNAAVDAVRLLPDPYFRRAVVLDTTSLEAVTRDLDLVAAKLARVALPVVPPDLVPPAADLPEKARDWLRSALLSCLTARGWQDVDVEAISRLVLGRWASMAADLAAAVHSVVADYLLISNTRPGIVKPDWMAQIEANVGGAITPIADVLEVARSRQVAHEERQVMTARTDLAETVALASEREALLAKIDYARNMAPRGGDLTPAERDTIARARGAARPLRKKVSEARARPALAELDPLVEDTVAAPLRTVTAAVEARREAVAGERAQQREREVEDKHQAAAQTKAAREAASGARKSAAARQKQLQALYRRRTTPTSEPTLHALVGAECLTQRSEQYEEETGTSRFHRGIPGDFARAVAARTGLPTLSKPDPVYGMKTRTWYEDRAGKGWWADRLVAWRSPAVDAVLQAAAKAEGLSPLTRPAPPRVSPR